jgi:flagellar biosynthesis/type III secretory pathway ATPase
MGLSQGHKVGVYEGQGAGKLFLLEDAVSEAEIFIEPLALCSGLAHVRIQI